MSNDKYVSPLSERYASKEMQYIFCTGYEIQDPGENSGSRWPRQRKNWD